MISWKPWVGQPKGLAQLNRATSLANGLVFLSVPYQRYDLISKKFFTLVSAPTLNPDAGGIGFKTNGSSNYGYVIIPSVALTSYTIFAVVQGTSPGTSSWIVALGSTSNSTPIGTLASGNSTPTKVRLWMRDDNNNQPVTADSVKTVFDGMPHIVHMVLRLDASATWRYDCYIDGLFDSSNGIGSGSLVTTIDTVCIGALLRQGASQNFYNGLTYFAGVAAREWSAREIAEHAQNPYQLIVAPRQRAVSPAAAAAAARLKAIGSSGGFGGGVGTVAVGSAA